MLNSSYREEQKIPLYQQKHLAFLKTHTYTTIVFYPWPAVYVSLYVCVPVCDEICMMWIQRRFQYNDAICGNLPHLWIVFIKVGCFLAVYFKIGIQGLKKTVYRLLPAPVLQPLIPLLWRTLTGLFWFAPSQWKTVLLCNDVSDWMGASPVSAFGHWHSCIQWFALHRSILTPVAVQYRSHPEWYTGSYEVRICS